MTFRYMFPIYVCFQSNMMFPISNFCFQTLFHVSNIQFLFPISDVCFQYTFFVSKRKWCFQTTMFPMYVSNIHRAEKLTSKIFGTIFSWKNWALLLPEDFNDALVFQVSFGLSFLFALIWFFWEPSFFKRSKYKIFVSISRLGGS